MTGAREYYESASWLASRIRDADDLAVWELHCEGKPVRVIARTVGRTRSAVQRTIARLRRDLRWFEE